MNVHRHFKSESKYSKSSKFLVQNDSVPIRNEQHSHTPLASAPRHTPVIQRRSRATNSKVKQKPMTCQNRIFFGMVMMCVFSLFVSLFVDVVILEHVSPDLAGTWIILHLSMHCSICLKATTSMFAEMRELKYAHRIICLAWQLTRRSSCICSDGQRHSSWSLKSAFFSRNCAQTQTFWEFTRGCVASEDH